MPQAEPGSGSVQDRLTPVLRTVRAGNGFEEALEQILQVVRLGLVPAGERLPAERELAERLGISRVTLREVLKVLQDQGLVESRRGGTAERSCCRASTRAARTNCAGVSSRSTSRTCCGSVRYWRWGGGTVRGARPHGGAGRPSAGGARPHAGRPALRVPAAGHAAAPDPGRARRLAVAHRAVRGGAGDGERPAGLHPPAGAQPPALPAAARGAGGGGPRRGRGRGAGDDAGALRGHGGAAAGFLGIATAQRYEGVPLNPGRSAWRHDR